MKVNAWAGQWASHHASTCGHPLRMSRKRPSLAVRSIRVMFNGVCTFSRFHTETNDYDRLCGLGCAHHPDCLRHYNQCQRVAAIISDFWRHADDIVRPHAMLHDLLTQISCCGNKYGILILGIVDAFVYVHNHHRHGRDDPGNLEDY